MHRIRPTLDQISEIYIDESSQTKHRYLGLGGLIVNLQSSHALESAIGSARLPELPNGELKWTKVSTAKLPAYKRVVDAFFDSPAKFGPVHYHSVIIDTRKINDAIHNHGSRDIGFNKEVYQLCMKFGRLYTGRLFHVYPDNRSTTSSTDDLRLMLNRGVKKHGDKRDWPYRRLHFRDSKTAPILQLTDVLLGAFLFEMNGHSAAVDASESKRALSAYVLRRASILRPDRDTSMSGKYTVWHRQLR